MGGAAAFPLAVAAQTERIARVGVLMLALPNHRSSGQVTDPERL